MRRQILLGYYKLQLESVSGDSESKVQSPDPNPSKNKYLDGISS